MSHRPLACTKALWGPRGGWSHGERMKVRRRGRSWGVTDESPQSPMKGRAHAEGSEWGNTWNLWAGECVPTCCVSLCNPECVGATGSVGQRHWKVSNVFVWRRGGIRAAQCRAVIPVFPFLPLLTLQYFFAPWQMSLSFLYSAVFKL